MSNSSCRKPPRWTEPFLLVLIRTGEVREAAKWAGVDFTTVYARRKKYADFADAWDGALQTHKRLAAEAEEEELRSLDKLGTNGCPGDIREPELGTNGGLGDDRSDGPSPGSPLASPTSPASWRGLQVKRVNSARWSEARERRFFDELVASANVRRAAEAAGVSGQAVYARRAKSAVFRKRWDQALANGRAAIEMGLVAEAKRSMDPDEMDLPAPEPRVTVGEAIKITQMAQVSARGRGRAAWGEAGFQDDEGEAFEQRKEELRARLQRKLEALRDRIVREQGWVEDEEFGVAIPPGWIRDPDYVPKPRG